MLQYTSATRLIVFYFVAARLVDIWVVPITQPVSQAQFIRQHYKRFTSGFGYVHKLIALIFVYFTYDLFVL